MLKETERGARFLKCNILESNNVNINAMQRDSISKIFKAGFLRCFERKWLKYVSYECRRSFLPVT